jgi:hypothetical protein
MGRHPPMSDVDGLGGMASSSARTDAQHATHGLVGEVRPIAQVEDRTLTSGQAVDLGLHHRPVQEILSIV